MAPLRVFLALLFALAPLAGCYSSITLFRDENTARLAGSNVLFLSPALLPPVTAPQLNRLIETVEAGLAVSPHVGQVITRKDAAARQNLPLAIRRDYALFSNTLSLVGFSNPEISRRLGKTFGVKMLAMVQMTYQRCQVCELGNQLWMVAHVVEAETGRIILRANFRAPLEKPEASQIEQAARELAEIYLEEFNLAFVPKWHRLRFFNLKKRIRDPNFRQSPPGTAAL